MFAVLEIDSEKSGHQIPFFRVKKQPKPVMRKVEVTGSVPYLIVTAKMIKKNIPFCDIAEVCGRCASRMIIPKNIELPERCGLREFVPSYYPHILTLFLAADVLRKCKTEARDITLSVIDKKGILINHIEFIVKLAGTIKIITTNRNYSNLAENIFDKYGAAIIITDNKNALDKSDIIIAVDTDELSGDEKGLIFTYGKPRIRGLSQNIICGGDVCLGGEYTKYLPMNIDMLQFASALYEICGLKKIENLKFEKLFLNDEQVSLKRIVLTLDNIVGCMKEYDSNTINNA